MKPQRRQGSSNPENCQDTRATIIAMTKYIPDDDKIARYVKCDVAFVRKVRWSRDVNRHERRKVQKVIAAHEPDMQPDNGGGERLAYIVKTRKQDAAFQAALGRVL